MAVNLTQNYGWDSEATPCSCGYVAPKILQLINSIGAKRVLDLGSGNGALCSLMRQRGIDAVGVEFDGKAIQIAKSAHAGIPFYNYGVQDEPAKLMQNEKLFDAVVSTEVIEHLFSPHLLPNYAAQTLKDSGFLIVSTPYHGYLKNLILSLSNHWDFHHTVLWHGGHIKFFSRVTLTKLLESNGFQVVSFYGVGRFPFMWKSMVIVARKKAVAR